MTNVEIGKCYEVFFERGPLQNPVIIKINNIYKDIDVWTEYEVDYIDAEALDDNWKYYKNIKFIKKHIGEYIPISDCNLIESQKNLAFSKILNDKLGHNSGYLNPDIMSKISEYSRSLSEMRMREEKRKVGEINENKRIAEYLETLNQFGSGRKLTKKRKKNKKKKRKSSNKRKSSKKH